MQSVRDYVLSLLPKGKTGAEIGVWTGDFSARILEVAEPRRLHLIDPFVTRTEPAYAQAWYGTAGGIDMDHVRNGVADRFADEIAADRVHLHIQPSQEAMAKFPPGSLDFVYIDGDHTYDAVSSDLELSFLACCPGAMICLDDYVSDGWWGDDVIRAAHEFLGKHVADCEILFCYGGQLVIGVLPQD